MLESSSKVLAQHMKEHDLKLFELTDSEDVGEYHKQKKYRVDRGSCGINRFHRQTGCDV